MGDWGERWSARLGDPPADLDQTLAPLWQRVGSLGGWLRVAAVRLALDALPAGHEISDEDEVAQAVAGQLDPESELLRERYQAEFQEALEVCLAALPPRERTLLRLAYVNGLS